MGRQHNISLTRRDMLKLSAGGAGMFMISAGGLAIPKGFGSGGSGGSGNVFIEAFPTSPLILNPFADTVDGQLPIPTALRPMDAGYLKSLQDSGQDPYDRNKQDCFGANPNVGPIQKGYYADRYKQRLGTHQVFPGDTLPAPGGKNYNWSGAQISTANLRPIDATGAKMVPYRIELQVAQHRFTTSKVLPIDSFGKAIAPPNGSSVSLNSDGTTYLPASTIYGFNGTFPGPRINAQYGVGQCVRFENNLGYNPNNYPRIDFGAPNYAFLTHLHNGHTAPESDGQPHYSYHRFMSCGDTSRASDIGDKELHYRAAWEPGEWVNQMYLGYPAGGDDTEKQSFFWFHDHVHGHTGANVYKGMVGLMPIYDPDMDNGDERTGYRLPGKRTDYGDGTFDVDYDIPMALYDCRLDDGTTPHKDAHNGNGETHPEWWGMSYFRHFPNHGFVGDVFTVNGKAYPTLRVKRRRYRFRFLDASISRIYNLQLQTSKNGPVAARDLGYTGDELQGQWRLPDGQQCMKWYQVANEGGLLPGVIERNDFELWPAKRKEFVVDFTKWMDGTDTPKGQDTVLYLVDTMKMTTGRMWDPADPAYKVPLMKIIIEADPQETYKNTDYSLPPKSLGPLRKNQPLVGTPATALAAIKDNGIPTFELQRGSTPDPETEWLINGLTFDPLKPMISPVKDSGAYWRVRNGGGGWVHPMHLHMEEHTVLGRGGKPDVALGGTNARHPDDTAKEDVIALDPSEETVISRRFRTFTGPAAPKLRAAEKAKITAEKDAYVDPALAEQARELGQQKFQEADWPGAVDAFTEMTKRAPKDPRGFSNRAAALIKLMAFPQAVQDCDEAIARDPKFIRAYMRKGQALVAMKEYNRAIDTFTEAAEQDDGTHAREIEQQQQKCLEAQFSARAGETEQQTMERIQNDPEIMAILNDPVMQSILNQAKSDPAALQEHMKNASVRIKIQKLIAAGVIRMGR